MKKIISIGYNIPGNGELCEEYSSKQSLLDADIIIFEPDITGYEIDTKYSTYKGKTLYSENGSFRLLEDTQHWKSELLTALHEGKTVLVFFSKYIDFFVNTGKTQEKRRHTSFIVDIKHNYGFFPIELPTIIPKKGKEIIFKGDQKFSLLWNEFKDCIKFESYIDGIIDHPLFITKTGNKIVGAQFKVDRGNLILLPPIRYDDEKFTEYRDDDSFWTKEACQFGERLIKVIVDIDDSFKSILKTTPPPLWIDTRKYELPEEINIKRKIQRQSSKIDKIVENKNKLQKELFDISILKNLLFEKGEILEYAIIEALKILGYKAETYDNGFLQLDQIIVSPEKLRFIGEAEGKDDNAIHADKIRQLMSNISEDLKRDEVDEPAIGILFGNGYRLMDPEKRKDQFTQKCKNIAATSNFILIKTMDLFKVVRYIKITKDEHYSKVCREVIFQSRGSIAKFPNIPNKRKK